VIEMKVKFFRNDVIIEIIVKPQLKRKLCIVAMCIMRISNCTRHTQFDYVYLMVNTFNV